MPDRIAAASIIVASALAAGLCIFSVWCYFISKFLDRGRGDDPPEWHNHPLVVQRRRTEGAMFVIAVFFGIVIATAVQFIAEK